MIEYYPQPFDLWGFYFYFIFSVEKERADNDLILDSDFWNGGFCYTVFFDDRFRGYISGSDFFMY